MLDDSLLIRQSRVAGEITRTEDKLLHAIFEFDDTICRHIMLPSAEVVSFNVGQSAAECLAIAQREKHTRYPVSDGGIDQVIGIVHIKDMLGIDPSADFDMRKIMRPPHYVPETLPISQLLRHFQGTRQLLALVADEYGNVIGIVTLENVLEQIVGPVEDEFDVETPAIIPTGDGTFEILGGAAVNSVNRRLKLALPEDEADTLSGLLASRLNRIPGTGDRVEFEGAVAEVIDASSSRARKVKMIINPEDSAPEPIVETAAPSEPAGAGDSTGKVEQAGEAQ